MITIAGVERPDRLAGVFETSADSPGRFSSMSYATYRDNRDSNPAFTGLAAYAVHRPFVMGAETVDSERVFGEFVSANYFEVLGVRPAAGHIPVGQEYQPRMVLHVRADDARRVARLVRNELKRLDPDLGATTVEPLSQVLDQALVQHRMAASLTTTFGALALILAALGIYSLMSYITGQRAREMGIRMAMGATRRDLVNLVLGRGMRLAGAGLAIGIALAFASTRFISGAHLRHQPYRSADVRRCFRTARCDRRRRNSGPGLARQSYRPDENATDVGALTATRVSGTIQIARGWGANAGNDPGGR